MTLADTIRAFGQTVGTAGTQLANRPSYYWAAAQSPQVYAPSYSSTGGLSFQSASSVSTAQPLSQQIATPTGITTAYANSVNVASLPATASVVSGITTNYASSVDVANASVLASNTTNTITTQSAGDVEFSAAGNYLFKDFSLDTGRTGVERQTLPSEVSGKQVSTGTANAFNYFAAGTSAAIQIGSTLWGNHYANKTAKAQARVAQAQAQIQANAYAAEGVGNEITAQRLAQAYGAQEYEAIRQQRAYMEDMKLDAAARGGEINEGSNAYMASAQQAEFDRQNAYASLQNDREQANYMLAANQCYINAGLSIKQGQITAASIKSQNKYQTTSNWLNLGTGLLGTAAKWYDRNYKINTTKYTL